MMHDLCQFLYLCVIFPPCSGNIPNGEIDQGEVVCDYLQPFPVKGTGYHRMVFVLYKQDSKIDYSKMKKTVPW